MTHQINLHVDLSENVKIVALDDMILDDMSLLWCLDINGSKKYISTKGYMFKFQDEKFEFENSKIMCNEETTKAFAEALSRVPEMKNRFIGMYKYSLDEEPTPIEVFAKACYGILRDWNTIHVKVFSFIKTGGAK